MRLPQRNPNARVSAAALQTRFGGCQISDDDLIATIALCATFGNVGSPQDLEIRRAVCQDPGLSTSLPSAIDVVEHPDAACPLQDRDDEAIAADAQL